MEVSSKQLKQEHKDEKNTIIETRFFTRFKICSGLVHSINGVIGKELKVQSVYNKTEEQTNSDTPLG
jgi:hypothetical protein